MFIDASAILAILNRDAGWEALVKALEVAKTPPHVSPITRLDAIATLATSRVPLDQAVTPAQFSLAEQAVDAFLTEIKVKTVMISDSIGHAAFDALCRYGRDVGHDAALTYGDCIAYACAKAYRLPLLYAGDHFRRTDLA